MTAAEASAYVVDTASWADDREAIERVRRAVFIEEQRIDERDEWDDVDPVATHVLAFARSAGAKRDAVGTGRLEPTGKIGRVAVLLQYRGTGAGVAIMQRLLGLAAARGFGEVYLHAQATARGFYERLGYRADGPEFDEVGIAHLRMRRTTGNRDGHEGGHDGSGFEPPLEP